MTGDFGKVWLVSLEII